MNYGSILSFYKNKAISKRKMSMLFVLFAIALNACSKDYIKLYKENGELLNETAFILTNDYKNIMDSDTCNRKQQINYYIKKNNILPCNQYVPVNLIDNINGIFDRNLVTAIYGNEDYIEFYTKREINSGISTIYYFAYYENADYYTKLKQDANAQIYEINSKWLYIIYENDD